MLVEDKLVRCLHLVTKFEFNRFYYHDCATKYVMLWVREMYTVFCNQMIQENCSSLKKSHVYDRILGLAFMSLLKVLIRKI